MTNCIEAIRQLQPTSVRTLTSDHSCYIFFNAEAQGVHITKFRADACCYEKATVESMEEKSVQYYIRAEMIAGLRIALEDEREWTSVMLEERKVEVCSIEEKLFGTDSYRRIVAYCYAVKGQMRLKNFILYFVTLTGKWIKTGRRHVLKIFTTKDDRPLFAT